MEGGGSIKRWVTRILLTLGMFVITVALVVWWLWIPSEQEPAYQFKRTWGESGAEPGQFRDPTGIATTQDEVFVSDARNGRIQVFDHAGRYQRQFGNRGDESSRLGRPMNLSIHNNELYVADYWNDRIQVYGLDGTLHRTIGSSGDGPGQFNAPGGVAVNTKGELYVADFYNQRVQHLKGDGSFIRQWGSSGNTGVRPGEFNYPTDVAIGENGQLIVADGYNDHVQVFEPSGTFLRKWGGPLAINIFGPFRGWFATVTSVSVGLQGNVYVADFYNDRVQKFDPHGRFLTSFGADKATYITAVAAADNGSICC